MAASEEEHESDWPATIGLDTLLDKFLPLKNRKDFLWISQNGLFRHCEKVMNNYK